ADRHVAAIAIDDDRQRVAGAHADGALQIGKVADRRAVDRLHDVAGLQPGRRRGAAFDDRVDPGGHHVAAENAENGREDGYRENEIRNRASGDDGRTFGNVLSGKRATLVLRRHLRQRIAIGAAHLVIVAQEADVAAERDQRQPPPRPRTVVEAEEFRTEADRKYFDRHTAPARDEEVAEL